MINIDNARSYKKEASLMKALTEHGLADRRPLIVCNRSGRFTAVFGMKLADMQGADIAFIANLGFPCIN